MASDVDPWSTGSFNAPYSAAFRAFMQEGWGKLEEPQLPPSPPAELLAARRARFRDRLPAPWPCVVTSGQPAPRNDDQQYLFRPSSDYVWLGGEQTPGGVLVVDPTSPAADVLYLQPPSRRDDGEFYRNGAHGELWVGRRPTLEARAERLGITCRPLDEAPAALAALGPVLAAGAYDAGIEEHIAGRQLDDGDRAVAAVLSELRLVKDDWEIGQLQAAVAATINGFGDVARLLQAGRGLTERHVEAAFASRGRIDGNGVGYHPVVAAGTHATILHWNTNDGPLLAEDLLLLDAGVETASLYTADITRTLPIGRKFSPLQQEVYQHVLAAQNAALAILRPGLDFREYHRVCSRVLAEGLEELGVLPVSAAESLTPEGGQHRRWTLHAAGHMLGLDVHDCSRAREATYLGGPLVAGQVLTVEPGLYFQSSDETVPADLRGIGVRIEDDVLITPDGCRVLSAALPRRPGDVEAWWANPAGWDDPA